MFRININGHDVDFAPGLSFKYTENSAIFNTEGLQGDTSHPISLPYSDKNVKIFGRLYDTSVVNSTQTEFDCIVFQDEIELIRGLFRITSISNGYIKGKIVGNITSISDSYQTKISEIDYSGYPTVNNHPNTVVQSTHERFYINNQNVAFPYIFFPVMNENMYKDAEPAFKAYHVDFWQSIMNHFNPVNAWNDMSTSLNDNKGFKQRTPNYINFLFPQLEYVLKKIFIGLGFTPSGSFFAHPDVKKIFIISCNAQPNSYDIAQALPDMTVAEFLTAIANKFNVGYTFNLLQRSVQVNFNKDILDYTQVQDITAKVLPEKSLEPSDQSGYTFRDSVDSNDEYAKKYVQDMSKFTDVITVSYFANLPASTSRDQVAYVSAEEKYYIFSGTLGAEAWEFLAYKDDYAEWNNHESIRESGVNTIYNELQEVTYKDFDESAPTILSQQPAGITIPIMSQQCNNTRVSDDSGNPITGNEFGLKLAFFGGMRERNGAYYPVGTCSNRTPDGTSIAGFTLYTGGLKGTHAMFWEDFLKQINEKDIIKKKAMFNKHDLSTLNRSLPVRIHDEIFFIKSLQASYPIRSATSLDLIKLKPLIT